MSYIHYNMLTKEVDLTLRLCMDNSVYILCIAPNGTLLSFRETRFLQDFDTKRAIVAHLTLGSELEMIRPRLLSLKFWASPPRRNACCDFSNTATPVMLDPLIV
jgi:hypothetical protein